MENLAICNNKIQPTDIEIFSKFVNLRELKIGTTEEKLKQGKHNKFYGSLKSYQNLTKLESICIEATDVNEGLEYLPESLAKETKKKEQEEERKNLFVHYSSRGGYSVIECSPHNTDAKCRAIQDQLRPFNYDLEAWQLVHPKLMVKVWKEKYQDKQKLISELETKIIQTQQELQQTKSQEAGKTKKISRLEEKLKLLEETKSKLEKELEQEQQQHNQTKTNFQSQLRDLATILFPSNSDISNISFSALKSQAEKIKEENQEQKKQLKELNNILYPNQELNFTNLEVKIKERAK